MKFSLEWLKHFLDTDASVEELAEKMTQIGLEVEGVEDPAERFEGFSVAHVLTADKHPDADKLQVLTVDTGDGKPLQVVCGAPNARAGMKGVLGQPGATVPANGMVLKKAAIRGVESNGMMCSVRELELGDEHDGIIELPEDAPVGATFANYSGASPVFDVFITPDRADCMGVMGIARDLAAAGIGTFKPVEVPTIEASEPCPVEIRTDDPEGCPAFYGRVIKGVKNGASPDWMQRRLIAAGQRPISALVDCTNYLMLATGRPAHVYDLAKLSGTVVARRAKAGEKVLALNEKEYELDDTMTVIADDTGVHDIGGIMGGEHSGADENTTDVLLEIAYFDPDRIAKTGQKLMLTSDARTRFERGVDPAFLDDGLALLTDLILQTCGGTPSEVVRAGTPPTTREAIAFDWNRTAALGGIDVPQDRQVEILQSLGFTVDGDSVTAPTWRHDVDGQADLVEEVARIVGFDQVPSTPLPREEGVAHPTASRSQIVERKLRRAAASRGFNEAITWSFIPTEQADLFGGAPNIVANPISEDMKAMRPSLLPGLAAAARRNLDRGADSVRLFEIGRRYLAEGERPTAAVLMTGNKAPRSWAKGKAQGFDAFDAKAEAIALLEAAGAPTGNLMLMMDAGDTWHPGRSAKLGLGPKKILARFGEPHPSLAKALDLPKGTVIAELYLDNIPAPKNQERARVQYSPPALQAVTRDFAFTVPSDLAAGDLERAIAGADKKLITGVRTFDRYEGSDALSLAIEVTLQPNEKSFTEEELTAVSKKIVEAAEKKGATLRA
ncbi:phenylalanine--tRNA ligase subunit beta [Sphingomicrobium clamense]|uniref:Phenylalanine--tRNA ligase beta subunit n=1 Tax=Sphingomicrobium clamense TaxID=2851013 RepID=A0ABS6V2X1_9SPHN|nr:phenylalanine--tRNA ligase subunit beta [Sphingomicrobium sp. B8]MBW0143909.1 phenylalanine--tRNA ligase subunit beta [Sphingomicrobium sp. B8]